MAPRVCRLWHQLSLGITSSLAVTITTAEAAEQLSLWISNHPTALESLELNLARAVCNTQGVQPLLQSVGAADQLRSLNISIPPPFISADISLVNLTKLTSLSIDGCSFRGGSLRHSMPNLTTLKRLSLGKIFDGMPWWPFMQQISTGLVRLTSLDLYCSCDLEAADMAVLHALPQLQQLQLKHDIPASDLSKLGPLPVTEIHILMLGEDAEADVYGWLQRSAVNLRQVGIRRLSHSEHPAILPLVPLQQALQLRDLFIFGLQPNMTELGALTQLTKLDLDTCGLDDRAVYRLSSLSGLRVLALCDNKDISGAEGSMEVLADSMPHLTSLILGRTNAWEAAEHAFMSRKVTVYHW